MNWPVVLMVVFVLLCGAGEVAHRWDYYRQHDAEVDARIEAVPLTPLLEEKRAQGPYAEQAWKAARRRWTSGEPIAVVRARGLAQKRERKATYETARG